MNRLGMLKLLLPLAVSSWVCAPAAHATAAMRLFDGPSCSNSNCITIYDNGVVVSEHGTTGAAGVLAYDGFVSAVVTLGNVFAVNVQTGESKPLLPGGNAMDLSTNNVVASGNGILHIWWSDVDFQLYPGMAEMHAGGTLNRGAGNITYNAYADPGNSLFAPTSLLGSLGPWQTRSFSGDLTGSVRVPPANYALMQELILRIPAATYLSGDFSLEIVPEPGSVALLGGALLLAAAFMRRRTGRA